MKNTVISVMLDEMLEKKEEYRKIENSKAFMAFNIDYLFWDTTYKCHRFAFSHYYKHPSGDMIADPDMEVLYDPDTKDIYGVTYQDTYGYQRASNGREMKKLSRFLIIWLKNVVQQQYLK